MLSWEEAIHDLESSAEEVLKLMARSSVPDRMPQDMPPVAQRIWNHCKGLKAELHSEEFEEIAP